jgi:hypothetical protein
MDIEIIIFLAMIVLLGIKIFVDQYDKRQLHHTIERQNDTIQRLINREPVTYAEVGKTPVKPTREVYAAWGNQTVNIDEDESRSG